MLNQDVSLLGASCRECGYKVRARSALHARHATVAGSKQHGDTSRTKSRVLVAKLTARLFNS